MFRAELTCPSLAVKLASEEATHFYGEAPPSASDAAAAESDLKSSSAEPLPQ